MFSSVGSNNNNNNDSSSASSSLLSSSYQQQLLSSLEPGQRNMIIANRLRWYGTFQDAEKEAKARRLAELQQQAKSGNNTNSSKNSGSSSSPTSRATALAELMKLKQQQKVAAAQTKKLSLSDRMKGISANSPSSSPKLKPVVTSTNNDNGNNNNEQKSAALTQAIHTKKPLWIIDPQTKRWVKRTNNTLAAPSSSSKNTSSTSLPFLENPGKPTINWSFSDAEFNAVVQRITASGEEFELNQHETRKLFQMVAHQFGAKFFVISDRWGGGDDEKSGEETNNEKFSANSLYRHYCLFVSTLGEIRRDALTLVLEATKEQQSNMTKDDDNPHKNSNNLLHSQSNKKISSTMKNLPQQVATALFDRHPQLKNSDFFVTDKNVLQQREEILKKLADEVSAEDCIGNEFMERMTEMQYQSAILSAKCDFSRVVITNTCSSSSKKNAKEEGENYTHQRVKVEDEENEKEQEKDTKDEEDGDKEDEEIDLSWMNLEAEKAAAMTMLFAEQRRFFAFLPGTIRSAIDDFIFLDLPVGGGGSGSSSGGGGGGNIGANLTNNNTTQQQQSFSSATATVMMNTNTTKAHKDLEDFLERHLQSFVPAASDEIMKRIDALRAVVAATTVIERENSRIKSSLVGIRKLTDEAEGLKEEVLSVPPSKAAALLGKQQVQQEVKKESGVRRARDE